jgi:hypothetical protein
MGCWNTGIYIYTYRAYNHQTHMGDNGILLYIIGISLQKSSFFRGG